MHGLRGGLESKTAAAARTLHRSATFHPRSARIIRIHLVLSFGTEYGTIYTAGCVHVQFNQHNSIERRYNEDFFATIATQKYEKFTSQVPGSRGGWWAIFGIDAKSGYLVA